MGRRRQPPIRVEDTLWGRQVARYGSTVSGAMLMRVFSTVTPGDLSTSSTPFCYPVASTDYADHAPHYEPPRPVRCAYCGTLRKPWTYDNCINCGAPA